ncbi:copper radical oxidase [Ramaria rubella]|nr:copper radical oxidase [Ramaria rubella]
MLCSRDIRIHRIDATRTLNNGTRDTCHVTVFPSVSSMSFLTLSTLCVVSTLFSFVYTESAWNGYVIPDSNLTSRPFLPYYVPPSATSYDDTHSAMVFSPANAWRVFHSKNYVTHTLHITAQPNAYFIFKFHGTQVELFGSVGKQYGIANIFVNGNFVERIDAFSAHSRTQQRLFSRSGLVPGLHTVKVVNTGRKRPRSSGTFLGIDAVVVTPSQPTLSPSSNKPAVFSASPPSSRILNLAASNDATAVPSSPWTLVQKGLTGVHAMQVSVVSETHAIIMDKVEHNPLTIDGHPAWGALYDLTTDELQPLHVTSNSFCAGGTFLSNGTLINVGGNPVVVDKTGAADFGDVNGLQAVRIFEPCGSTNTKLCDIYENPSRIRMASARWYNTVIRVSDGSAMIIGGSIKGGWMNNATTNNPTIEFFPPKNIHGQNGLPIPLKLLSDTLNSNLFPIAFSLPDERVFIAANNDATIYNWQSNTERRLPPIPNGVRVTYPMTGTALLLPLTPANDYAPEVLICGGSAVDDTRPGYELTSQEPASDQCARMVLTDAGIQAGWQIEHMPHARVMPDAVLLPTGQIVIVNGGATGISGYGNVQEQVGQSNADNPVLQSVLYDPSAAPGARFSTDGMPTSEIPRLYHSVATLTPRGDVMIAGSNPNLDRSDVRYGTEYRVEWLSPPYVAMQRPSWIGDIPEMIGFGAQVDIEVDLGFSTAVVSVSLMDLGYITHAVHANVRMVVLSSKVASTGKSLTVMGPPSAGIYPPGPGFLYLVVNGVPSVGRQIMIGDGKSPPTDEGAIANLLHSTQEV